VAAGVEGGSSCNCISTSEDNAKVNSVSKHNHKGMLYDGIY